MIPIEILAFKVSAQLFKTSKHAVDENFAAGS